MKICLICAKEFPTKIEIDGKSRNLCNRKYCLECSPWQQHNTKKLHALKSEEVLKISKYCPRCKTNKSIAEFHNRRNGKGKSTYCKICTSNQTLERQRALKIKAIEYLGGKCMHCGITGLPVIFDFHHRNPSQKEFTIGKSGKLKSLDNVKAELDKCDLLCSNCHRLEHSRLHKISRA